LINPHYCSHVVTELSLTGSHRSLLGQMAGEPRDSEPLPPYQKKTVHDLRSGGAQG
jgi:hypothetical protein